MFKRILVAYALAALCTTAACAADGSDSFTGNVLIRDCHLYVKALNGDKGFTWRQAGSGAVCNSYVGGVLDGIVGTQMRDGSAIVCVPSTVTYNQATRVVSRWLDNHPGQLNDYAGLLVFRALREAWPCKGKK